MFGYYFLSRRPAERTDHAGISGKQTCLGLSSLYLPSQWTEDGERSSMPGMEAPKGVSEGKAVSAVPCLAQFHANKPD